MTGRHLARRILLLTLAVCVIYPAAGHIRSVLQFQRIMGNQAAINHAVLIGAIRILVVTVGVILDFLGNPIAKYFNVALYGLFATYNVSVGIAGGELSGMIIPGVIFLAATIVLALLYRDFHRQMPHTG
jgi:hypothetical protein